MKKNIAMRVAAFLFILTMISTCAFATTFAKYTTSDSATDTARVAKWGVNVDVAVPTTGAFQSSYTNGSDTTVEGKNSAKVVAPGTSVTNALTVTITGTPEVDVEIKYEATVSLTGWEAGTFKDGETTKNTYCPLVITVNGTQYKIDTTNTDATKLAAAIEKAIEDLSVANIDANTNLAATDALTHDLKISWAWAYEVEGTDTVKAAANANDTALGNLTTAPQISISVTCTVTQND